MGRVGDKGRGEEEVGFFVAYLLVSKIGAIMTRPGEGFDRRLVIRGHVADIERVCDMVCKAEEWGVGNGSARGDERLRSERSPLGGSACRGENADKNRGNKVRRNSHGRGSNDEVAADAQIGSRPGIVAGADAGICLALGGDRAIER